MKKKPIRLLVLVSAFARDKHYSGDFTLDLTNGLARLGFEINVLAPHDHGLKKKETISGLKVNRFVYFYPQKYQKLAYGGGIPYNIKHSFLAKIQVPFFMIAELIASVCLVKKKKIEVIQTHWLLSQGLVGAIIQKYWKIPHVATMHSSEVTFLKNMFGGRWLAGFILRNSTKIVSVSHHRLEELLSFVDPKTASMVRSKTSVTAMGVDLKTYIKRNQKNHIEITGKPKILFVGRLVEVKGCKYLIHALKTVVRSLPDAHLTIVGTGPLELELKQLSAQLKLNNHITFVGFVDHKSITSYYIATDIIAFPSIIDSSGYQEGLPVVLLEALASGKPVIATDIKGSLELIQDGFNGFLVKQSSPAQMAKKIIEICREDRMVDMGKNALKSAHKYGWRVISRDYAKVLKSAINCVIIK